MPEQFTDEELDVIWSKWGNLAPQLFPKYYAMGPVPLTLDGTSSGAAGARAVLTKELSNFPQILYGIRISNVYELPNPVAEEEITQLQTYSEILDGQQTIEINLSQQNVTAQPMLQSHLTGRGLSVWHPFPAPYPMAGGNSVNVTIQRVTSYATFAEGTKPEPVVFATLLCAEFKATRSTTSVKRVLGGR